MCTRRHTGFSTLRLYSKILLLLWLAVASAQSVAGGEPALPPLSIIDIPVRLSLEPLTNAAEKALPLQAGHWHGWKDWHGIKFRYRAWRGPLGISVSGDVLLVQAHIRYWVRARKKLLGAVNLKGSCGIDEPPRQAVIAMQVRLGWGPDWTLRPEFRLLPTRFLDRCEMTIANIDVTPLIEKQFRKQMQHSLRTALRKLAPGVNAIQRQAQRSWTLLQQPVALGEDRWLLLRPAGVALSRIDGHGNNIDAQLAVSLRPLLMTGAEPVGKPLPLPPLGRHYPRSAGLNLQLGVNLDFAALSQQFSDSLAGRSFDVNGRKAGINRFVLSGSGQKIRARVELSGEIAGTVELQARVAYDRQQHRLELHELMFDYDAEDATLGLFVETFHDVIRQALEGAANQALARQLERLSERLETILQNITPAGVAVDMSSLQLHALQIEILPQGIRLDGTAAGSVRLVLR